MARAPGPREPCHPDRDNTEDDAFAALVEMSLAAGVLGDETAQALAQEVAAHPRFGEISEFWWGAVAATGNVSLLTLRPPGLDLSPIRSNLYRYAEERIEHMGVGYPGVTKDVRSDRWKSGDRDDVDSNWRWASNRMLLDDAILLAIAAEEKRDEGEGEAAARYARHALRVMDYILGTNAMALSMVTGFGEHAVERTHDGHVPDTEPGKLALGPNNWTNSDDPDMPPFGSLPGMKMMPVTGTGWAAREVAIDGNAPLVWMAWWARHQAATSWRWRPWVRPIGDDDRRVARGLTRRIGAHSLSAVRPDRRSPMTRLHASRFALLLPVLGADSARTALADVAVTGTRATWHPITLSLTGPDTSETATPNPFFDVRLVVRFENGDTVLRGAGLLRRRREGAAQTGADAGNVWRARFVPDRPGQWRYTVSFRTGEGIALSDDAGTALEGDGATGTIDVEPDEEAPGLLRYVGERYLRFAGSGEWFLKAGADSPENFLAYVGFDGMEDRAAAGEEREGEAALSPLHAYEPHVGDFRDGDPTWRDGRGKGIIGALNYLAGKGVNSVYFLTMNVEGDGKDVWPWTTADERYRFDCSKLDQWEIVFSHMDRLGIALHVVLTETENESLMELEEGGVFFAERRRLYYRELVARFGHHRAIVWNLGEENGWDDRGKSSTGNVRAAQLPRAAAGVRRRAPSAGPLRPAHRGAHPSRPPGRHLPPPAGPRRRSRGRRCRSTTPRTCTTRR